MFFLKKKYSCQSTQEKKEEKIESKGIYVLGSGCKKCNQLEENVKKALKVLNSKEEIFHITDFKVIASIGVMATPSLIIDNKVVSSGKVINESECLALIKEQRKL